MKRARSVSFGQYRDAALSGLLTDLRAQFMALMTMADGVSVIKGDDFENRFMHARNSRMGGNVSVDGQRDGARCEKAERRAGDEPVSGRR
ncbi:MAG: hypothetical protein R3C42_00585 [Parvularculaceae bacterium]